MDEPIGKGLKQSKRLVTDDDRAIDDVISFGRQRQDYEQKKLFDLSDEELQHGIYAAVH